MSLDPSANQPYIFESNFTGSLSGQVKVDTTGSHINVSGALTRAQLDSAPVDVSIITDQFDQLVNASEQITGTLITNQEEYIGVLDQQLASSNEQTLLLGSINNKLIVVKNELDEVQVKQEETKASLEQKLDMVNANLDSLELKADETNANLDSIEVKLDTANANLDSIEVKLDEANLTLHSIDNKVYNDFQPSENSISVVISKDVNRFNATSVAGTNSTSIKSGPTQLYNIVATNNNLLGFVRFLKIFDKATAPTAADVPVMTFQLKSQDTSSWNISDYGIKFENGFGYRLTGGFADADNTGIGAGECKVLFSYN